MNITPHILLGSGRLTSYQSKINEVFVKTTEKISSKVSISDVDVVIYDNPRGVIRETGVGGYTLDAHIIFISLDPAFSNFEHTISKELGRMLTHELHHVLRWKNPGYGKTLLEALITEGLADHFDIEINNESPHPWCHALNNSQLEEMLKKVQVEFDNKNYNHNAWFFGSKEKGIPRWAGYSLGYKLVNDYLQSNPDKKPSTIYALEAEEFIK